MAASVALVAVVGVFLNQADTGRVGEIAFVTGSDRASPALKVGAGVHEGEVLRTQASEYVSIRLESGVVLSVGPKSEVALHDPELVTLNSGQVYVDADVGQLRLLTPHLQVVDIGTIYQAKASADETWVALREGQVELAFANQQLALNSTAGSGDFVRVASSGEIADRGELETTDTAWTWHKVAREPLGLDGLDVNAYVRWVARDNGIELKYRSAIVAQQAELELLAAPRAQTTDNYPIDRALETTSFSVDKINEHTWILDFRGG